MFSSPKCKAASSEQRERRGSQGEGRLDSSIPTTRRFSRRHWLAMDRRPIMITFRLCASLCFTSCSTIVTLGATVLHSGIVVAVPAAHQQRTVACPPLAPGSTANDEPVPIGRKGGGARNLTSQREVASSWSPPTLSPPLLSSRSAFCAHIFFSYTASPTQLTAVVVYTA